MSSILEMIEVTQRARRGSPRDRIRRQLPEPIADSCRALLEEAAALELDFDAVINAVRKQAAHSNNSHNPTS